MGYEKIDDELTYGIIGCAMRVHAALAMDFYKLSTNRHL